MKDKIIQKTKRIFFSQYHRLRSRNLKLQDGDYQAPYAVAFYSERCGVEAFGAKNLAEYEYWWRRACGIVAIRMVIDTLKPSKRKFVILTEIKHAIKKGAYHQYKDGGKLIETGWIHHKLADIARENDLLARPLRIDLNGICQAIVSGKLVIASANGPVERFIKNPSHQKAGGHLLLVKGFSWKDGECTGIYINDPYDKSERKNPVDAKLFRDAIYSGSAIITGR